MTQVSLAGSAVAYEDAVALRPGELRVEQQRIADGTCLVSVAGEVDMHTASRLAEVLDPAFGSGAAAAVIDLTACSFIDSSGLEVLVGADKRLRRSGRRLALVVSGRRVARVLEVTGLDTFFRVYGSHAAAFSGVREGWAEEARRRVFIRGTNERLERSCVGPGATNEGRFVFICECGDRACTSLLHLSLAEYESVRAHPARFVVARNHENPEDERVVAECVGFAVVETVTGELSKAALETNPRWQRGEPW